MIYGRYVDFIACDSPVAAANLAGRVIERITNASQFPLSNRPGPEKGDSAIREVILKPYRIIYTIDERLASLHVLRVWHASCGIPEIQS